MQFFSLFMLKSLSYEEPQYLNLVYVVVLTAEKVLYKYFIKDYPLVLCSEVLSQEVPYLGGVAEMKFYVEGLRFPDKGFDGLISINLSLLEPISEVRPTILYIKQFVMLSKIYTPVIQNESKLKVH